METWELVAREQIRDLVARYNANGDSGRFDPMLALFTDDAVLSVDANHYRGVAQIRAMFEQAAGETRLREGSFIRHFTATHQIDVIDERSATGRCYFQVLTDDGLDHWGRYIDEYASSGAAWRFASRTVHVDGRVPGAWSDRVQGSRRGR